MIHRGGARQDGKRWSGSRDLTNNGQKQSYRSYVLKLGGEERRQQKGQETSFGAKGENGDYALYAVFCLDRSLGASIEIQKSRGGVKTG